MWQTRFQHRLTALEQAGLRRTLEPHAGAQGTMLSIAGERLINFCSNDYLGLASHPCVIEALHEGATRFGVGSGAAALLSGHSAAHEALAEALATATGHESAVVFSSGYLANLGIFSALVEREDRVISDELNHASLIDGVRLSRATNLRYRHAEIAHVTDILASNSDTPQWVVTDGLFSMDGDVAPLPALAAAAQAHRAMLVCDDAHGFGVLGNGRGTVAHFGLSAQAVPLLVVTFGKALGTQGAAVVGPAMLTDLLVQRARTFVFDTAPSPALMHATRRALAMALTDEEGVRTRLHANIARFKSWRQSHGLPVPRVDSPIQPLLIGDDRHALEVAAALRRAGFYVRAIRPPTVPPGTARLRVCLSASHTTAQIDALIDALTPHLGCFRLAA